MKIIFFILPLLLLTTGLRAEETTEDDAPNSDIEILCHLVTSGKSFPTAEGYLTQLKRLRKIPQEANQAPTEFDEDEARTVIAAWMNLSETEKKAAAKNQNLCYEAIANEYQGQD